jgi:hypothetical protein
MMLKLADAQEMQCTGGLYSEGSEVQSQIGRFPDQLTDVTCVIGHGDSDLCKLTSWSVCCLHLHH